MTRLLKNIGLPKARFDTLFTILLCLPGLSVALSNDSLTTGDITGTEVDSYSFSATAGDTVSIRLADIASFIFSPLISVTTPSGSQVFADSDATVAGVDFIAPESGVYAVDASSAGATVNHSGFYHLYFQLIPGSNELGTLADAAFVNENLDRGDLDSFIVSASSGQRIIAKVGQTVAGSGYDPLLALHAPSGALLDSQTSGSSALVDALVSETGDFILSSSDSDTFLSFAGSGGYNINAVTIPGTNELGVLVNGSPVNFDIENGDIDSFQFLASAGDAITLELALAGAASGGFTPQVRLYDPTALLVQQETISVTNSIVLSATLPASGLYTVVVLDSDDSATGNLDLTLEGATTVESVSIPVPFIYLAPLAILMMTIYRLSRR